MYGVVCSALWISRLHIVRHLITNHLTATALGDKVLWKGVPRKRLGVLGSSHSKFPCDRNNRVLGCVKGGWSKKGCGVFWEWGCEKILVGVWESNFGCMFVVEK
jgi:hypothetical protein